MGFFNSIFGIDILGTGEPDIFDDAVILGALEEEEREESRRNEAIGEEDDAIASGAIDEFLGF